MAERYGYLAANDDRSFNVKGHAETYLKLELAVPIPELKWLHAIHNQGHGDAVRGGKAKAEGVKAGVWDIFLPVPIELYATNKENTSFDWFHGLYIEMKVGYNKLSDEQLLFQEYAKDVGYKCDDVCYSWIEARDAMLDYLGLV
jgi:hypothetical protein